MKKLLILSFFIWSCAPAQENNSISDNTKDSTSTGTQPKDSLKKVNKIGEIGLPEGYIRDTSDAFGYYIRNINLKESNTVYLYNGQLKYNQKAQYRVLDIDRGTRDLQQCADAVMRLRSDYLYNSNQKERIGFHFVSGDYCPYTKYRDGYRVRVSGSKVTWVKSKSKDTSYQCYRKYLDLVYMYAGTASLIKEMKPKSIDNLSIGDVIIQKGNPYGHAMMIVDIASNKEGKKIFMLAQSYMPAQDIHIVVNPRSPTRSPWFEAKDGNIITPEWYFHSSDLRTWGE